MIVNIEGGTKRQTPKKDEEYVDLFNGEYPL